MVDAFLKALQSGDFEALVAVLDPDVLVHIDEAAARPGGPREIRGARNWAQGAIAFSQMTRFAQAALVDGSVGVVFAPDGKLDRVLRFTIAHGKIVQADIIAEPARLRDLDLAVLWRLIGSTSVWRCARTEYLILELSCEHARFASGTD